MFLTLARMQQNMQHFCTFHGKNVNMETQHLKCQGGVDVWAFEKKPVS